MPPLLEDNLPDFSTLSSESTKNSDLPDDSFTPVPYNRQNNTPNLVLNANLKENDSPQALSKEKLSSSVTTLDPISRPLTATQNSKRKSKGKQMATRRSQRLQAKQRTSRPMPKYSDKVNSQTSKIRFNLDTSDAPLDPAKRLEILQASGLQINERIEQLIQDAAERDKANDNDDGPTPTTPLHAHIPPLMVPGEDIVL